MNKKYPPEVEEFVRVHMDQHTNDELIEMIKSEFGLEMTVYAMRSYIKNRKLKRTVKQIKEHHHKIYTPEVEAFIRENVKGCPYKDLRDKVNERFGLGITTSSLRGFCKTKKIQNGFTGRFEKGHIPPNKGKKGFCHPKCRETWFKNHHLPVNYREVGSVRRSVDGYFEIKIADPNKWELLNHYIWKAAGREVPKGYRLIFKDSDTTNCTLDNLMLVPMRIHLQLNKKRLRDTNAEITETYVNLLKLKNAARDIENGKKKRN